MSQETPTARVELVLKSTEQQGRIIVTLKDDSGNLLAGKEVFVESWNDNTVDISGTTDPNGVAEFSVPVKSYQVSSNPDGYEANYVIIDKSDFQ